MEKDIDVPCSSGISKHFPKCHAVGPMVILSCSPGCIGSLLPLFHLLLPV